jgi:hypothetical protein
MGLGATATVARKRSRANFSIPAFGTRRTISRVGVVEHVFNRPNEHLDMALQGNRVIH